MTRYKNWRELAEECRSSGMSVHGWSLKNGIPNSTCRQWVAKLKEEDGGSSKPIEVWGKIQLSETCVNAGNFLTQMGVKKFPALTNRREL